MRSLLQGCLPSTPRLRKASIGAIFAAWTLALCAPAICMAIALQVEGAFELPESTIRDIETIQAEASLRAIGTIADRTPSGEWRRTWVSEGVWISRGSDKLLVPSWKRTWDTTTQIPTTSPVVVDDKPGLTIAGRCSDLVKMAVRLLPAHRFEVAAMNSDYTKWKAVDPANADVSCLLGTKTGDTIMIRLAS
jgi:hypothetical protein